MKRSIFLLIFTFMLILILASCANSDNISGDTLGNNSVIFNEIESYTTIGSRLVEPVIVTETDFRLEYDIDFTHLLGDAKYDIIYRLDYHLEEETLKPDLSKLSNGVVTVLENDKVIFVVYVSNDSPIANYVVDKADLKDSKINGCNVRLFDLLSSHHSSLLYGEFKLEDCYITCSMYDKTEKDMLSFVETLIKTGKAE